jgi:phosphate-selective porin OprO and OprP
MAGYDLR